MKIKLLKRVRKSVRLGERNGMYYVHTGCVTFGYGDSKDAALDSYRFWILQKAKDVFGIKPKKYLR